MIEKSKVRRVLPIHVINPRTDKELTLSHGEELESLINTLGYIVVDRIIQKLDRPDNATYIGRGKVEEVIQKIESENIDIVVLNAMAKPGQIHALKLKFESVNKYIEVWDRVDLILHIFDKHARTTEAKLQIELARMRYMGPRIFGMGFVMSRQGGGIGTQGIGETNTELMKRHWRKEVKRIEVQLNAISKSRLNQLDRRRKAGFKTVSIVGYTNAGKSSLFNLLSGKHALIKDALFATLDSQVGKLYIPLINEQVLITDTIGFIQNLPPRLIQSFKSTLLESLNADILLHVIDVSDSQMHKKIQVVNEILGELGRSIEDIVFVFNKTDKKFITEKSEIVSMYKNNSPQFVSTKNKTGIAEIQQIIAQKLQGLSK